jgi:hypothetical protein
VSHAVNIKRGVRFWQKCPHGDAYRYPVNRTCRVCANARRRELRAQSPEKYRAKKRAWWANRKAKRGVANV